MGVSGLGKYIRMEEETILRCPPDGEFCPLHLSTFTLRITIYLHNLKKKSQAAVLNIYQESTVRILRKEVWEPIKINV